MNQLGANDDIEDLMGDDGTDGHGGGVLDGAGLKDYDRVKTAVHPEGVKVGLKCWACNKGGNLVLEWPEVITVAENGQGVKPVLPQGWQFSQRNHDAFVAKPCPRCGHEEGFAAHLTPEEAQQHVRHGLNAGFVNQQQIAGIQHRVAAYRQQR